MINGRYAFVIYMSMKMHFSDSSDYSLAKYNYVKKLAKNYNKRNDRSMFDRLAKKYNREPILRQFLIPNVFKNPDVWVRDLLNEDSHKNYLRFYGKQKILKSVFSKDSNQIIKETIVKDIKFDENFVNLVFTKFINNVIEPESMIIFIDTFPKLFKKHLDKVTAYCYIYKYRLEAYKYFLFMSNVNDYRKIFEANYKGGLQNWHGSKEESQIEIEII